MDSTTSRELAWRTVALREDNGTYPAEGRAGGLLPPGPCSPRGSRHPSGWGPGGGRAAWPAGRKPRASPEVVLRALARGSRGRGSRRVPSSSGTAGLGHVLQREESGTRARRPGRGATSWGPGAGVWRAAIPPAAQDADHCQSLARERDLGKPGGKKEV